MKFIVKKSSSWGYREEIEINTLEELLKFRQEEGGGGEIIIGGHDEDTPEVEPYIEIYDYYRE